MSRPTGQVRNRLCWWLLPVVPLILPPGAATAQETGPSRIYEEQLRVRLDEQLPAAREEGLDFGGWFNMALFNFDDAGASKERTLRQFQLRTWVSLNIRGVHRAYARALLNYDDWNSNTNPSIDRKDDYEEDLERIWYQFDWGQMMRNQTGVLPAVAWRVKVGREFATIGTALVLSMPLDMIQFDLSTPDWELTAFLGRTDRDSRNIDDSFSVATHQDRVMFGVQAVYRSLDRHRPFVYFLNNHDNTSASPPDAAQAYEYSSHYVGAGSEGTLPILQPNLRYQAEIVGEWGETYSDGVTAGQDNIEAMAIDVLLEYLFRTRTHPKVMFEYIFASGDSDRRNSATATAGGNEPGTYDHAFNAFGFRDTGLAFSPRISNIHIWMIGASFFPLENLDLFRKMEIGSKVFFYSKAVHGPISDTLAVNDVRRLGWEWDVYCNWRLTSDLAWTLRYGAFWPGGSFENANSTRNFLYTGIVFSF